MMQNQDELKHYGVLGMKWGVRRNPSKAMEKASKKLNKLNNKAQKSVRKSIKKRYGLFGNEEKYRKQKVKTERYMYKGQKWYNAMEKEFSKTNVVSISERDRIIGRNFAKFFEEASLADFNNSDYHKNQS